jgi:hypothetical protein
MNANPTSNMIASKLANLDVSISSELALAHVRDFELLPV